MRKFQLSLGLVTLSFFINENIWANKLLTEEVLVRWVRENSSLSDITQAESSGKKLESRLIEEQYQARLKLRHSRQKTDEKGAVYQPQLSPFTQTSLMAEKKIPVGVAVAAGVFAQQSSLQDGTLVDDTQVGAQIQAEIDLWKNFLGRKDRAQLNLSQNKFKTADLESRLDLRRREFQVRKIFWSLIAVEKSLELSNELLKSAETQLKEAEKRLSAGVSDRGEVAKYKSQVESRKASQLLFEYERQLLASEIEKILYSFKHSEWKIPENEFETKELIVGQCLNQISNQKNDIMKLSDNSEIISSLKSQSDAEIIIARQHSGMDLQLFGQWQTSGRANSYEDAQSDLNRENKSGYTLGIQMTVPLDNKSASSEKELLELKNKQYQSRIYSLQNELTTTHEKMSVSLEILKRGLLTQASNSKNLETNYNEMRRKFQQGRIPFTNLIAEQDLLFQSKLQEISLKKQIAHATLDYLSVFNNFPCAWNQY